MQRHCTTEKETFLLAQELSTAITDGAFIYLSGTLGVGKTTFVRGFLRALGYQDKVKSPTFTLVESYEIDGQSIYHFDLYRLANANELEMIGIREYFSPTAICLVEWPEKGFPLLPPPDLTCTISVIDEVRTIKIAAETARGQAILAHLE